MRLAHLATLQSGVPCGALRVYGKWILDDAKRPHALRQLRLSMSPMLVAVPAHHREASATTDVHLEEHWHHLSTVYEEFG